MRNPRSENADAYALLTEALALEPDNAVVLAHAAWALEPPSHDGLAADRA